MGGWVLNALLLAAAVAWVFADGTAPANAAMLWRRITGESPAGEAWNTAAFVLAAGSLTVVVLGLLFGPVRSRTTKAWLLATGLAAGWCGLLVGWDDLYWRAQQRRLNHDLAAVGRLATQLAADWPTADGDLPEVGPYLAYPRRQPTTLLFMGQGQLVGTGLRISSIENTGDEVLVELSGAETGAWLTHRRDNKAPDRLVTGLEVSLRPVRTAPLGGGWRLVRYAVNED